jgi:hypothetical protein
VDFVDRQTDFAAPTVGWRRARVDDVWKHTVRFNGTSEMRLPQSRPNFHRIHPMQLSIKDAIVDHTAQVCVGGGVRVSIPPVG